MKADLETGRLGDGEKARLPMTPALPRLLRVLHRGRPRHHRPAPLPGSFGWLAREANRRERRRELAALALSVALALAGAGAFAWSLWNLFTP